MLTLLTSKPIALFTLAIALAGVLSVLWYKGKADRAYASVATLEGKLSTLKEAHTQAIEFNEYQTNVIKNLQEVYAKQDAALKELSSTEQSIRIRSSNAINQMRTIERNNPDAKKFSDMPIPNATNGLLSSARAPNEKRSSDDQANAINDAAR